MAPSLEHCPAGADPEVLLSQARGGKPEALGPLLQQYRDYLALLARLQIDAGVQGKVDPSDLMQETFLEAHRSFAAFRGTTETEFVQWLRRIMATRLGKLIRRYYGTKGRDARLERRLYDELDQSSQAIGAVLAASDTSPSVRMAHREQTVYLAKALAMLPEEQREAVVLRHLEGKSTEEVADQMGRTSGSVRGLCARAMARLRCLLRE